MKILNKIAVSSLLILLGGCVNLTNYEPSMFQIQFGLLQKTVSEKYTVIETDAISHQPGTNSQTFGYLITPKLDNKYVYNAVLVFPDKPLKQQDKLLDENKQLPPQEFNMPEVETRGPSATNMWLTGEDGKGVYKIKLFINGTLADSREFLIH
jgi:hypothetical protein